MHGCPDSFEESTHFHGLGCTRFQIPVTVGISIARSSRGGYALAESPSELEPTGSHKEQGPGAELCAELGSPTKEPTAQRYVEQSHGVKREKKGR